MERSPLETAGGAPIALASLRPVLEYGWPSAARWLASGGAESASASLEQPTGEAVAFRLRIDEGWRLRAAVGLPDGAAPALAWARIGLRPAGGRERTIWSGLVLRAGRPRPRRIDVELAAGRSEVDLVLRARAIGVDRVRWTEPAFHRGELAWRR